MSAASEKARPDPAVGNRARTAIGWASGGASPDSEPEPEPAPQPEGEREGYETGARLGASPGEVYEATHARLPGRFAIKFLTRARGATAAAIEAFQTEAEQVSVLRHPNVVEVIELGVMPDGTPILVMEHLEGRTLEEILANSGPLALPEVVPTIKAIASALEAAHKVGVVHREVRPDNVLIANVTGYELGFPKLLDFGVSRLNAGPSPGSNLATAAARYLAPEQARAQAGEVDPRTDQYALAALAYRMLSGTDAFGGNDVISILYRILNEPPRPLTALARVDTTIDSIIRKAMSRDKRLRFDSVFVFAKALEDAAGMGSRMVRNPLLGVPTPSPVRFVPSTAPAPAPERPITGPVSTRSERSTSERPPERSARQSLSSDRLAVQRREDRTAASSSDRLPEQRGDWAEPEQDVAPERSSDRLSESRAERAFAPERSSDRLSDQRVDRGERTSAERSSDRSSEQRAPEGRDRGDNMWSSDRLPEQRSKDRSERTLSFRDTLSERFFAEGERKAEQGAWTAEDLDDERPEGADAFDDFDDVPRRRWPMIAGLAIAAALVPVIVMYLPDLRLLFDSRPSVFWNEPVADQTVLPTTVPGLPNTATAEAAPGAAAPVAAPAPAPAAAPVGNAAAAASVPAAAAPAPSRAAPRAATPPPPPVAAAPAQAAPSTVPSAPAQPPVPSQAPPPAAAPSGGWAQQQPAAAAPSGGWAQQQPAAAPPAGGWAQPPAPPAGGWQTAPAQPAAPAQPIQPTTSAAWAPVNPTPATAPPAAREPRSDPATVPLRGYVWSPKERRLVPAN